MGWLGQSTADFTVLGGDFNTDPRDNETSYSDLKSLMVSQHRNNIINNHDDVITGQLHRGILPGHQVVAGA